MNKNMHADGSDLNTWRVIVNPASYPLCYVGHTDTLPIY